jgi:hypothetical protein
LTEEKGSSIATEVVADRDTKEKGSWVINVIKYDSQYKYHNITDRGGPNKHPIVITLHPPT